jgi:hypothetical protein
MCLVLLLERIAEEPGISLLETMIALTILLVATVGIMAMAIVALQTTENQGHLQSRAAEYAQDKMEQLISLGYLPVGHGDYGRDRFRALVQQRGHAAFSKVGFRCHNRAAFLRGYSRDVRDCHLAHVHRDFRPGRLPHGTLLATKRDARRIRFLERAVIAKTLRSELREVI